MTRRVSLAVLVVVLLGVLLGYEALSAKGRPETAVLAAEAPPPSTTSSSTTSLPETVTTTTAVPRPVTTHPSRSLTTPTTRPVPVTGNWAALINQYDWPTGTAYKVMMCESGGNAGAYNASGATGLFQIHPGGSRYFDPATNVAAAYSKYKASGWGPWVSSRSCWS